MRDFKKYTDILRKIGFWLEVVAMLGELVDKLASKLEAKTGR